MVVKVKLNEASKEPRIIKPSHNVMLASGVDGNQKDRVPLC